MEGNIDKQIENPTPPPQNEAKKPLFEKVREFVSKPKEEPKEPSSPVASLTKDDIEKLLEGHLTKYKAEIEARLEKEYKPILDNHNKNLEKNYLATLNEIAKSSEIDTKDLDKTALEKAIFTKHFPDVDFADVPPAKMEGMLEALRYQSKAKENQAKLEQFNSNPTDLTTDKIAAKVLEEAAKNNKKTTN